MTKQEFIQEAALRFISTAKDIEVTYEEIAGAAKKLADEIYGKDEKQEREFLYGIPADEPITNLIREIDRLDWEEKLQLKEEYNVKYPHYNYKPKKSGYAEKVRKQCSILGFKQVLSLIDYGRTEFCKQSNIGQKTLNMVDKALLNLYNVNVW